MMKIRRSMTLIFLLLASCSIIKSKPKDDVQLFMDIQAQTPKTFEALGEWAALGKITDTTAAKHFKGDTLMNGFFRFVYQEGDFRFEFYQPGGAPLAYVVNHEDTFALFSYKDQLTILTPPDGSLASLGVGLKPRDFPFLLLIFATPYPPDSVYYEGGNIIYLVKDKQITVNPETHQILRFARANVELTFQDYRKVGSSWRPFFVSARGSFPFKMVDRMDLRITKQHINPRFSPDLFAAQPPATSKTLNLFPKNRND
jgi:hypothetical protein